jgi:hypothetical protein
MFYTFRYAENKDRSNEPWVIRQCGVYQKLDFQNKKSLFILINAVPNSEAHRRVLQSLASDRCQVHSRSLWLHSVVHASYFANWRGYIAEYEKQLLPIVSGYQAFVGVIRLMR